MFIDVWDSSDENKIQADTKRTVVISFQILDRKATEPSRRDYRQLADLD